MTIQDFFTNINIAYSLLMIVVLLFAGLVWATSSKKVSSR